MQFEEQYIKCLLDNLVEVKIELEKLVGQDMEKLNNPQNYHIVDKTLELGRIFYELSLYEKLENELEKTLGDVGDI